MTTEPLFTERQRFTQVWLWMLLLGVNAYSVYGLVKQVFLGEAFGGKPMSNQHVIIAVSLVFLVTILFAFLRLDTAIRQDGIYYRFLPFQWNYRKISWERILRASVRQYRPIAEYGGWGLRISMFGKGQAFNVSGDQGLQLVYDNGKKFLLGTQEATAIAQVLKKLGQLSPEV
jgi:hypothetical protein